MRAEWFACPGHPIFTGHFPGLPILPGVLGIEMIAQAGGACCLLAEGSDQSKIGVLGGLGGNTRFRRPILPGDSVVVEVRIVHYKLNASAKIAGEVRVGGELACSAEDVTLVVTSKEALLAKYGIAV